MGISTVERLRFKRRTSNVPNLMYKLLEFVLTCKHFRPMNIVKMVRLIKFDVLINRRTCTVWVELNRYKVRNMKWSNWNLNWALQRELHGHADQHIGRKGVTFTYQSSIMAGTESTSIGIDTKSLQSTQIHGIYLWRRRFWFFNWTMESHVTSNYRNV